MLLYHNEFSDKIILNSKENKQYTFKLTTINVVKGKKMYYIMVNYQTICQGKNDLLYYSKLYF